MRVVSLLRVDAFPLAAIFGKVNDDLQEPVRRKVGGDLAKLPPLARLEMLRRKALLLRGGKWQRPADDGTYVRKTVGAAR